MPSPCSPRDARKSRQSNAAPWVSPPTEGAEASLSEIRDQNVCSPLLQRRPASLRIASSLLPPSPNYFYLNPGRRRSPTIATSSTIHSLSSILGTDCIILSCTYFSKLQPSFPILRSPSPRFSFLPSPLSRSASIQTAITNRTIARKIWASATSIRYAPTHHCHYARSSAPSRPSWAPAVSRPTATRATLKWPTQSFSKARHPLHTSQL